MSAHTCYGVGMNPLDMLFLLGVYAAFGAMAISLAFAAVCVILIQIAEKGKAKTATRWLKGFAISAVVCFALAVLFIGGRILIAAGAA